MADTVHDSRATVFSGGQIQSTRAPWPCPPGSGPAPSDLLGVGPGSPLTDPLPVLSFSLSLSLCLSMSLFLPVSLCVSLSHLSPISLCLSVSLRVSVSYCLCLSFSPAPRLDPRLPGQLRPSQCPRARPPATNPVSNLPTASPCGAGSWPPGALTCCLEDLSNPGSPSAQRPVLRHRVPPTLQL